MLTRLALIVGVALSALAVDAAPRRQPRIDVTGSYSSNWGEVVLVQRGTISDGEYVCCGGGRIEGRLEGRMIRYRWIEAQWNLERVEQIAR